MRFIEGETLDDAIVRYHVNAGNRPGRAEESVEYRRLLNSFVSVCKTVAYAHNRGIVHRDIKPANVILGRYGETVVVDWGLATPVVRDDRFRVSGELTLMPSSGSQSGTSSHGGAGTLAYMSPEQASELAPTPSSDVYSLGATLYKILCGVPAFSGENFSEIKQKVIEGRFLRPSRRDVPVAGPLEAICLRAMSTQPRDRYETAIALANDIENYLADAPVSVLKETLTVKLGRWARRHRAAVRAIFLAILAVTVISALASVKLGQMARAEQAAHHSADESRLEAEQARRDNLPRLCPLPCQVDCVRDRPSLENPRIGSPLRCTSSHDRRDQPRSRRRRSGRVASSLAQRAQAVERGCRQELRLVCLLSERHSGRAGSSPQ